MMAIWVLLRLFKGEVSSLSSISRNLNKEQIPLPTKLKSIGFIFDSPRRWTWWQSLPDLVLASSSPTLASFFCSLAFILMPSFYKTYSFWYLCLELGNLEPDLGNHTRLAARVLRWEIPLPVNFYCKLKFLTFKCPGSTLKSQFSIVKCLDLSLNADWLPGARSLRRVRRMSTPTNCPSSFFWSALPFLVMLMLIWMIILISNPILTLILLRMMKLMVSLRLICWYWCWCWRWYRCGWWCCCWGWGWYVDIDTMVDVEAFVVTSVDIKKGVYVFN